MKTSKNLLAGYFGLFYCRYRI